MNTRKLVVGISGASGAPYAKRFLDHLIPMWEVGDLEVCVALSRTAEQVWEHECGGTLRSLPFPVFEGRDYDAPFASGSAGYDSMVVIPASMSSIARIAHGISDDILTRAADVMIKERRRLILVARETPYSTVHLENMLSVTRAGAVVLPATPSFYGRPHTLEESMDTVLSRVFDHLGISNDLQRRWGRDVSLSRASRETGIADRSQYASQQALNGEADVSDESEELYEPELTGGRHTIPLLRQQGAQGGKAKAKPSSWEE